MSAPLDLDNEADMEEMRKRYYEPFAEHCRKEWERAANEMDAMLADLINEQSKP